MLYYIQDQSFNNFDNDTLKLLVNKAQLISLWARNCYILFNKFFLRAQKVSGLFEKWAPGFLNAELSAIHRINCSSIFIYLVREPITIFPMTEIHSTTNNVIYFLNIWGQVVEIPFIKLVKTINIVISESSDPFNF